MFMYVNFTELLVSVFAITSLISTNYLNGNFIPLAKKKRLKVLWSLEIHQMKNKIIIKTMEAHTTR